MTKEERMEIDSIEARVSAIENKIDKILTTVRGIAIGLVIGGFLFGIIKMPELIKFFTK